MSASSGEIRTGGALRPRSWRRPRLWHLAFLAALAVVVLLPVMACVVGSFDVSSGVEGYRFGFAAWHNVLTDSETFMATLRSLILTLRVPIGLACGFAIAWAIVRLQVPGARAIEFLCWFAFFLPATPMLAGWILLLDADFGLANAGLITLGLPPVFDIRTGSGIIFVHLALQTIPFMVILGIPALRQLDRAHEEAAILAGARPWRVLTRVTLPAVAPAMLVAGLAGWIKALESFDVEQILGGVLGRNVLSTGIYNYVAGDPPRYAESMVLSTLLLALLLVLSLVYARAQKHRGGGAENRSGAQSPSAPPFGATLRNLVGAGIIVVLALMILLPFAMLILGSFMKLFGFFSLAEPWTTAHWRDALASPATFSALRATLLLGLATALPGTLLFALIAYGITRLSGPAAQAASVLVWLPWAFPGIILGVALLDVFLHVPGLNLLHGTLVPLIFSLLIRELPIGVHLFRTGMSEAHRSLAEAARIAGAGWWRSLTRVVLPMQMPTMVLVFLLIFAVAIRDVGAIVLLAPPGLETLSLLTFRSAATTQFEAASVLGTLTAFLALAVAWLAHRAGGRINRTGRPEEAAL